MKKLNVETGGGGGQRPKPEKAPANKPVTPKKNG
jgi:hypothetical protein